MTFWMTYGPDLVAGFVFVAGVLMLAGADWRWLLLNLAMVYAGAAALVALAWPWSLAATVMVSGWMAASVLGISQRSLEVPLPAERLSAKALRLLMGLLAGLLAAVFVAPMARWLPGMNPSQLWGSVALMLLGVWQVGLRSTRPLWVVSGLLTVLAGFEVLYAVLEQSLLLAGLLALVVVALALAGSYLVLQQAAEAEVMEEEELPL